VTSNLVFKSQSYCRCPWRIVRAADVRIRSVCDS